MRSGDKRLRSNYGSIMKIRPNIVDILKLDGPLIFYIGVTKNISHLDGSEFVVVRSGRDGEHAAYIRSNRC